MFLKSIGNENLSDVSIPSLFFDLYLPTATGDQIKVYLLGYKSAFLYNGCLDDGIDNSSIAMALGITREEVENIWLYWEEVGVVKISKSENHFNVKFLDIKHNYIKKHYKSDLPEDEYNEIEEVDNDNLFLDIESLIGRPLVPQEKIQIFDAKKLYSTSDFMIIEAFKTAINETGKIKSVGYITGIMKSWFDNSVKNIEDLNLLKEERNNKNSNYRRIFSALGFNRIPTESERVVMDRWIYEYNMGMDVILKACEKSINISNPNIKYFDSIISKWYKSGINTLDAIEEQEKKYSKEKSTKGSYYNKKLEPIKTKFHNFEQSKSEKYSKDNLKKIMIAGIPNPNKEDK